jgi:hypothetical protein
MIAFEEIDNRLKGIGKNRAWLAETTGRSPDSIRVALAPNAPAYKRTKLLARALSDAIEAEERRQQTPVSNTVPDTITLAPDADQYRTWSAAQKASDSVTLKDWAISELNAAAEKWARDKGLKIVPESQASREHDQAGNA